uniref:Pco128311 n=1 Tax=Arundo donax TaxID=35708 RepID=A0A0A9R670_ARUDO
MAESPGGLGLFQAIRQRKRQQHANFLALNVMRKTIGRIQSCYGYVLLLFSTTMTDIVPTVVVGL